MTTPPGRIEGYRSVASYLADGATALGALSVAGALAVAGTTTLDGNVALTDSQAANPTLTSTSRGAWTIGEDVNVGGHLNMTGTNKVIRAAQGASGGYSYYGDSDITGFYRASAYNNAVRTANAIAVSYINVSAAVLFQEVWATPANVANYASVFAKDDGAGKTALRVIFGTGAAIQLEIEV